MSDYTFDDVAKVLREVVAERPDYVYPHDYCVYRDEDGSPSCLIGHVIQRLDPDYFASISEQGNGATVRGLSWTDRFSVAEVRALRAAQMIQDTGQTWAEALATFELQIGRGR